MRVAFRRLLIVSVPLAAPGALAAQWRVTADTASATRLARATAVVRERADSLVAAEEATAFVIQCNGGQLEAFITTRDLLESDMAADVRVRVETDSARGHDMRWQATKANTGAFVPSAELRDLIQRRLIHSRSIRIVINTQRRGRVTYIFPLSDIRPALDALRTACPNHASRALTDPG